MSGTAQILWWSYRLAAPLALAVAVPWLAVKGLTNRRWRGVLAGRLALGNGEKAAPGARPLWLHAVSVGEVLALRAVVDRLQSTAPRLPLLVSTSTPTGRKLARETMPEGVRVRYFPLDTAGCVRRALDQEQPVAAAIMETELWPAFFRDCRLRDVPLAIINGRMSATSVRRYRKVRPLISQLLAGVDCGFFQTGDDLQRFIDLGLPRELGSVPGNLKYDLDNLQALTSGSRNGADIAAAWRAEEDTAVPRQLLVAGSTKPGEEQMLLDTLVPLMEERPGLLLLVAPRHPERFDEVDRLLGKCGLPHQRRSTIPEGGAPAPGCRLLLLDSLGELAGVYGQADITFVGGSLVPEGGHNILEPAFFGRPILFGPHMDNFAAMADLYLERQAAIQLSTASQLGPVLCGLLDDPETAGDIGRRAREILDENQGAAAVIANALAHMAGSGGA